jgi:cholesterol oxidase
MGVADRVPFPRRGGLLTGLLRNLGGSGGWGLPLAKTGLFELFFGDGVRVICSSNVGGGSHIYSAVHCKPAMPDFWDGHSESVSAEAMEPHYQAVLARMGSVTPTAEHRLPNTTFQRYSGSNVLEPAQPYKDARIGYLLPADPDRPTTATDANGVARREVDYRANDDGFLGSPGGGKTTLDVIYLWPAIKGGGLTVRDMTEAVEIRKTGTNSPRYQILLRNLRAGRRESLLADNVVVAAGALNTLRLLLRSRESGGLDGMARLGDGFGTNGDVVAYWNANSDVDLSAGLPTRGGFRPRGDEGPVLGGGPLPSIDAYPLPRGIREKLKRSQMVYGMGADAMDGTARYRDGRFALSFDAEDSATFREIHATIDKIAAVSGRRIRYPRKAWTVHPMGGARLGASPETGVIDANGEVFGHPGLFVTDSAAFPRSPGAPPTLSIAAWADHVADRFLERRAGGSSI